MLGLRRPESLVASDRGIHVSLALGCPAPDRECHRFLLRHQSGRMASPATSMFPLLATASNRLRLLLRTSPLALQRDLPGRAHTTPCTTALPYPTSPKVLPLAPPHSKNEVEKCIVEDGHDNTRIPVREWRCIIGSESLQFLARRNGKTTMQSLPLRAAEDMVRILHKPIYNNNNNNQVF
jgi:hypothetical protein